MSNFGEPLTFSMNAYNQEITDDIRRAAMLKVCELSATVDEARERFLQLGLL